MSRGVAALAAGLLSTSLLLVAPQAGGVEVEGRIAPACSQNATSWFRPVRASIPVVSTRIRVVEVGRHADGSMGAPPLTDAGKRMIGWDRQSTPPGYYKGSVPIDAHTWPDGTALGNKLLRSLHAGDRLILFGADGQKLCYRINERHEYPRDAVPERRVFRVGGDPQVALVVCSGRRLGPGNWLKRTIWFGMPIR